jgi:microcystin-dependent protein
MSLTIVPVDVNQTFEFNKDVCGILAYPLSNQLLFIASNAHEVYVNNLVSVTSNVTLNDVQLNTKNGFYSNVYLLTSNEWQINYDILPYATNTIELGASHGFQSAYLKDMVVGTVSCNIRIHKDSSQDTLVLNGSLYTQQLTIENSNDYLPVGSILPFGGNVLPSGFLWCDGSEVSKTVYSKLYQVVQNMYGVSTNPSLLFKVPDFRGRSPLGGSGGVGGGNDPFAMNASVYTSNYGGKEQVTLTNANLPSHYHIFNVQTSGSAVTQGSYGLVQQIFTRPLTDPNKFIVYETDTIGTGTEPDITENSVSGFSITTNPTGNGNPFTCVHPVLMTNFIIKY